MGYINPLLNLPAGKALLDMPKEDRARIEAVLRQLRDQANIEANKAWARKKGPMAAYWRAVSTYARHMAHALSKENKAANPYSIGVPAENWQRGYNGERCIAAVGSAAHTYWKEGVAARKAKEAPNDTTR